MPDDPRRQTKSKYTADRGIPGAFEGETVTRRRLMTGTAHVAGAVAAAAMALPALGFAVGPAFERLPAPRQPVGPATDFPGDSFVPRVIRLNADPVGDANLSTIFVRRRN